MNIGKAIKIALINNDKNQTWLAIELDISRQAVSQLCSKESAQIELIGKVADKFKMPVADLIALGE